MAKKKIADIINCGDDYQLAFSISRKRVKKAFDLAKELNIKLTVVGEFTKHNKTIEKKPFFKDGFKHF